MIFDLYAYIYIENSSKIRTFIPHQQDMFEHEICRSRELVLIQASMCQLTKTTKCNAFTPLFIFHFNDRAHLIILCSATYHMKQTPLGNSYSIRKIH